MAIVTIRELKEHLAFTDDIGGADDALLDRLRVAAQNHVERLLGCKIEEEFGGEDQDPVPEALHQAVVMLAAWWYDQRETALTGTIVANVPFDVREIVNEYREFTF
ncbi:head-tail connector protein [Sedimentitalea todarodis]|uniref:Head-tail connector protein n=1 Tax=Sedimentitalea todarodis TaxID=1631240 RepID=A0ABU3VHT7_9RHOB|nr:head-tail connector protein [Sedimentitalea todarodis]MDU9005748.1 head-tail connector protein [Sedimentitalea todarodis]